jgi:polysaccharide biosynthesis transport protein
MDTANDPGQPPVGERPGSLLSRVSDAIVMYHDPRGLHAEQYRACRTNLTALNKGGGPWAVVVTSSKKGEGKSVSAANIACCLAEVPGARVCLVDADFRQPIQATLFGLAQRPGITELLADKVSLSACLQPTVMPHVSLLATGEEPKSPADLLGGERFTGMVTELKRRYTWVVIDTPPVNPYTDACVLVPRTNGALLVVRMEDTHKDLVLRSVASIARAGGKVLGTFLAGLPTDREDADRVGYYRMGHDEREQGSAAAERDKSRREAERRLRSQEQAWLDRQRTDERNRTRGDEPKV